MRLLLAVAVLAGCGGGRHGDGDDFVDDGDLSLCVSSDVVSMLECEIGPGAAGYHCQDTGAACRRIVEDGFSVDCVDAVHPDAGWFDQCAETYRVMEALTACGEPRGVWPSDPSSYDCAAN